MTVLNGFAQREQVARLPASRDAQAAASASGAGVTDGLARIETLTRDLANEVRRIGSQMTRPTLLPVDASRSDTPLERAQRLYRARRRRSLALPELADLFHDPAWDILLDLFIASETHRAVSVSSACIGSASAATTGLRYLKLLRERGAVLYDGDPDDRRRHFVRLEPAIVEQMRTLLSGPDFGVSHIR